MQAVILAAGRGSRLQAESACKPLTPLLGSTLLERNARLALAAGARRVLVVTGHSHDALTAWWAQLAPPLRAKVELVHNPDWGSTENGYSLACAAGHLIDAPFLLLMADHVYSPELLAALTQCDPGTGAVLAVDRRLERRAIDPDDATRVRIENGHVTAIGKQLAPAHAYDTGAFLCAAATVPRLRGIPRDGDTRLSAWMQTLADERRLLACDVGEAYWQDVDTPADLAQARAGLLAGLAGKPTDGPVARYLNRPCSRWLTARLAGTRITPNLVSWLVLLITLLAAALIATASAWPVLLFAGLLVQAASILDGCDGELARLRGQSSAYGGWLDAQLDRYGDAALISALTWQALHGTGAAWVYWLGMAALAGSFMVSYSAHKSDRLLTERVRIGRDLRMLVLAAGAILQQPLAALGMLAIGMNLTVAIRLARMRHAMD